MMTGGVDESLLYQEIPLPSNFFLDNKCKEILINEGDEDGLSDCSFPDAGGGLTVSVDNQQKDFFWRTTGDVLELEERSFSHPITPKLRIVMRNSKLLPYVHMEQKKGVFYVLFSTIHAVHCIKIDLTKPIPKNQRGSILLGVTMKDLSGSRSSLYFNNTTVDFVGVSACVYETVDEDVPICMFSLISTQNNLTIITMSGGDATESCVTVLEASSRIARLLRGFNPFASSRSQDDVINDVTFASSSQAVKIMAISTEYRLFIWSSKNGKTFDHSCQIQLNEYIEDEVCKDEKEHRIIACCDEKSGRELVCIFIKLKDNSIFIVFEVSGRDDEVVHMATVHAPSSCGNTNMVDYKLSSGEEEGDVKLWMLCADPSQAMTLLVCDIAKHDWCEVTLDQAPLSELSVSQGTSVVDSFTREMFASGKFSQHSIAKALAITTQQHDSSMLYSNLHELKTTVLSYLQQEVKSRIDVEEEELSADEVEEVTFDIYSYFYRSTQQYQIDFSSPIGLTQPHHATVNVIKKNYVSYITPAHRLNAVCLGVDPSVFQDLLPEGSNFEDLGKLLHCLSSLSSALGEETIEDLIRLLPLQDSLEDCAQLTEVKNIFSCGDCEEIEDTLSTMDDFLAAVSMLVICLHPTSFQQDGDGDEIKLNEDGIDQLARSFTTFVNDRLRLSLLLYILATHQEEGGNKVLSDVLTLLRSYLALEWITITPTQRITSHSFTPHLSLNPLSLSQSDDGITLDGCSSLLTEYLRAEAARFLPCFFNPTGSGLFTKDLLTQATVAVSQVLWPCGPTYRFAQYLLRTSQYARLEHYVGKLLHPWCEFQPSYGCYLLAHCNLNNGHYDKAADKFISAVELIHEDELFLISELNVSDEDHTRFQIQMLYFNKVIDLFEQLELSEQVITLAKCAITFSPNHEDSLALRYSTIFRQCLALKRYEQAFWAITCNPNYDYRKNCLRSLVIRLCENGEHRKLCEFTYGSLNDEFVSIMEERARSCEIQLAYPSQYDLLYSFHVFRKNYRRGASMMYEQYWRLTNDEDMRRSSSMQSLHRRNNCLLLTLSSLKLVEQDNRYVLHRCQYSGNEGEGKQQQVIIKEADEIGKEIELMRAKMKLASSSSSSSSSDGEQSSQLHYDKADARETVTLLTHEAYFDDAFALSKTFCLSSTPVFQAVATRCVHSSYVEGDEVRKWLKRNEQPAQLSPLTMSDRAWMLLRHYLQLAPDNQHYRAVLDVLLSYRAVLPAWLVQDYKKINCAELLRRLYCYDYLQLATDVCVDYIDALLGVRPQDFNFQDTLINYKYPVWLPRKEISMLIRLLNEKQQENDDHATMYEELKSKMVEYNNALEASC